MKKHILTALTGQIEEIVEIKRAEAKVLKSY